MAFTLVASSGLITVPNLIDSSLTLISASLIDPGMVITPISLRCTILKVLSAFLTTTESRMDSVGVLLGARPKDCGWVRLRLDSICSASR